VRAVVQRVASAHVEIAGDVVGAIDRGLLVYLGLGRHDTDEDRSWMTAKIVHLRVFEDEAGKMARSVVDVGGSLLVVSQFTLYGDVRRGRRPSFDEAMDPTTACEAYETCVREMRSQGVRVETGKFRADMRVSSINDGPVTIWLDSAVRGSGDARRNAT
jgi:D-tyrosyl-tRNA(Tyr) deacylase